MSKIRSKIYELINDMFYTIFPDLCIACHKISKTRNSYFCINCIHNMPYTDHFKIGENTVTKHFKGRIPLTHGAALLSFRNQSNVKNMLHGLKYKGKKETGQILGEIAGQKLAESSLFEKPDLIIPVPIHYKKKLLRGYNQSGIFGQGVSNSSGIKMTESHLIKYTETASQTGMARTDRVKNVSTTFQINKPEELVGKHILVVDDVVTTGATLEACCLLLLKAGVKKISILTIAAAE